jgi:hypothetical protein
MNRWQLLWLNLAIRWDERHDPRSLHGETLIAQFDQWAMSPHKR